MKKLLRVFTSTLLAAAIVLSGMPGLPIFNDGLSLDMSWLKTIFASPQEVYAGSKSEEKREPDRTARYTFYSEGDNGANKRRVSGSTDTYILAVTMGNGATPDLCKYVTIKYYATASDYADNILSTQYMKIDAGDILKTYSGDAESYVTKDWPFIGSRKESYMPFYTNKAYTDKLTKNSALHNEDISGYGGTIFNLNGYPVLKRFDKYNDWIQSVITGSAVSLEKSGFYTVEEKISSKAFAAANTEYIRLKFEYGFYSLYELGFFCQKEDANKLLSFPVDRWVLYKHNGEINVSDNGYVYNPGSTRIENYAFVSDRLSLGFNGTPLYESVDTHGKYGADIGAASAATFIYRNVKDANNATISGDTSYFFQEATASQNKDVGDRCIYNFAINIADEYKAGIDSFLKDPTKGLGGYQECLYATIYYYDKDGFEQSVAVPVITNALLEFAIPVDEDPDDENDVVYMTPEASVQRLSKIKRKEYLSFAQEGDSLYFSVEFPSLRATNPIKEVELKYTPIEQSDALVIKDIVIYDNAGVNAFARRDLYTDNSDGCAIDQSLSGCNILYRSESKYDNAVLDVSENELVYEFAEAQVSTQITDVYENTEEKYLVTLTTSDNGSDNLSGTTADILVSFEYTAMNGQSLTTPDYNLMELCQEFYGYNPATIAIDTPESNKAGQQQKDTSGNLVYKTTYETTENGQYLWSMSEGQSLKFYINLPGLDKLTKVNFAFADVNSEDEWKPASLKLEKFVTGVSAIGKRICSSVDKTVELQTENGIKKSVMLNKSFDRNISGLILKFEKTDLKGTLVKNATLSIDCGNGNITSEEKKADYTQYKWSMAKDISLQDLGMNKSSVNFQVIVHVKDNKTSALRNDDCGSNNLFYFQLVFKSAGGATQSTSGFVLANNQLSADGFRSGQPESFYIDVNEDVGDVIGINIIPDNSTQLADPLDKLCIDYIDVIRTNPSTLNKRFVIENVEWITPNFVEEGEGTTNEGHTAAELVQYMPVSYSAYVVDLEFAMGIGDYGETDGVPNDVYVGNLLMTLSYQTSGATPRTVKTDVQVVKAIAEYTRKTPITDTDLGGYCSDPDTMFQGNSINRFKISLTDCGKLLSFKLTGHLKAGTSQNVFPISSMQVSVVNSSGFLDIGEDGFWYTVYEKEPTIIATGVEGGFPKKGLWFVASDNGTYLPSRGFAFTNPVDLSSLTSESAIENLVGRVPESANDKLNIFVYMKEGVKNQLEGGYNLQANLHYSSLAGNISYVARASSMTDQKDVNENGKEVAVIYAKDLDADNMAVLTNVNVRCDKLGDTSIQADYAVVQQVRNGIVINTYKISFGGSMVGLLSGGISMLSKFASDEIGYSQNVTLQLGEGTPKATMVTERYDIAVAIRYKSTAKSTDASGNETIYTSPYVFATDANASEIAPGSILSFDFNEAYVKSIEGINIQCLNNLKATVAAVSIKSYQTDSSENKVLKNVYSITDAFEGSNKLQSVDVGFRSGQDLHLLKRADLNFLTAADSMNIDSAGKAPIRMKLNYINTADKSVWKEVPDIRQYVSSGAGFGAGQNAVVSLFLEGAKKLRSVEVEPYVEGDSELGAWNLDTVYFTMEDFSTGAAVSASNQMHVNKTIYEDDPLTINLSTITVKIDVQTQAETSSSAIDFGSVINGTVNVRAEYGRKVYIHTTIGDSNYGYDVSIYRLVGESRIPVSSEGYTLSDYVWEIPFNDTTGDVEWLIEFTSQETEGVKSAVKITVPSDFEDLNFNLTRSSGTAESTKSETESPAEESKTE